MLMALVNCQREEDLVDGGVSTKAEALAPKSVDELSVYGRNYIKAFKELTQSSEFVPDFYAFFFAVFLLTFFQRWLLKLRITAF